MVSVPGFRARYYQEKREGLYGGAMFLSSYTLLSLPLSFISTIITVGILVPILELDAVSWAYASGNINKEINLQLGMAGFILLPFLAVI